MLKILSSEYQLYACGKIFRMPRFWDENLHFAKDSTYKRYKSGNKEKVQKKEQLEEDSSGVRRENPRR
jgi:hypothetical protein